jgi:hypothetical protein
MEDVVGAEARDRHQWRTMTQRCAHEAVAVPPEQPIAQLVRFDRLTKAARKHQYELTGNEKRIDVALRTVDSANRCSEPAHAGYGPPRVLAERPHAPPREQVDARHHKRDVEAERMIGDEERASLRDVLEAIHLDAELAAEAIDGARHARRNRWRVAEKCILLVRSEPIE